MKKLLYISLMTLALVKYAGAQEQLSVKQQADDLYGRYEYYKSVELYLRLIKKKGNDIKLIERIADCFRRINRYEEAGKWYAVAAANPKAAAITHYYYAEILLRDQQFDLAKQQYKLFYSKDAKALTTVLAACDSAAAWMKIPSVYSVKNYQILNSESSDWGLTYQGNAGLVFTSDRVNDPNELDYRTGNNWFKLYWSDVNGEKISEFDVTDGLKQHLNDYYHCGPAAFNKTGDTAYITVTTRTLGLLLPADNTTKAGSNVVTRRLELLIARKKADKWVVVRDFPYNNVKLYSLGDAALSNDGKVIYFTSDMPGGFGKTDIWYCEKQRDGSWGSPINCGKSINTAEEDEFPNIGGDGALYYASKGLPGMGGYDIYKATGQKNQWGTPQNLKYPINSTSDDFYLVTKDGIIGYLSSNRDGGKGSDDIYSFSLAHPATPAVAVTRKDTSKSNSPTSGFPDGLVLTTIYYDLDKSNIRADAMPKMDNLALVLKQKPALRIEISAYTDSRASDEYNMALSQRRALAALDYLIGKGIPSSRLITKYYGETHLVNDCGNGVPCTEAQHQLNRRTEFRVIEQGN